MAPAAAISRATSSAIGVFPLPPQVTFPTLTTGAGTDVAVRRPTSYAHRRAALTRPYATLRRDSAEANAQASGGGGRGRGDRPDGIAQSAHTRAGARAPGSAKDERAPGPARERGSLFGRCISNSASTTALRSQNSCAFPHPE